MSIIHATKKDRTTIFNLPNKTEVQALKHAKDWIKTTTKRIFGKRMYGWKFEIQ